MIRVVDLPGPITTSILGPMGRYRESAAGGLPDRSPVANRVFYSPAGPKLNDYACGWLDHEPG